MPLCIAGPSKTADIEQSLVLGAHGPRSLTVFLLDEEISDAGLLAYTKAHFLLIFYFCGRDKLIS